MIFLDTGFRRYDVRGIFLTFYEGIKIILGSRSETFFVPATANLAPAGSRIVAVAAAALRRQATP
jgi:hypothetical protein